MHVMLGSLRKMNYLKFRKTAGGIVSMISKCWITTYNFFKLQHEKLIKFPFFYLLCNARQITSNYYTGNTVTVPSKLECIALILWWFPTDVFVLRFSMKIKIKTSKYILMFKENLMLKLEKRLIRDTIIVLCALWEFFLKDYYCW